MIALVFAVACTPAPTMDAPLVPTDDVQVDDPVPVERTGTAVGIAVGSTSACTVHQDGDVWCWGRGTSGQLGDPSVDSASISEPVRVVGVETAVKVVAFMEYACALLDAGEVACWGWNHHWQLGDAVDRNETAWEAVRVPGVADVIDLAAGHHHVCAVQANGTSSCWGEPYSFRLGDGQTWSSTQPVASLGIEAAVSMSAGIEHACVVEADGQLSCWGSNLHGILGTGDQQARDVPTQLNIDPVVDADIHQAHACAVHDDGGVSCWGARPGHDDVLAPTRIDRLTGMVEVKVGSEGSCAIQDTGDLYCWGLDAIGSLDAPVDLPHRVEAVAAGALNVCAVDEAGETWCATGNPENPIVLGLVEWGDWVRIPGLPAAE